MTVGCSSVQYAPQGMAKSSETIDLPLYSAVVPAISVFKNDPWKRFKRAGALNDLILTNGWQDESYAASITVISGSGIKTLADLQNRSSIDGVSLAKAKRVVTSQENLLCVRPSMAGEVKPYPKGSFFMHVMACIDTRTHTYYELAVSQQKIDDRGMVTHPSAELELGANQFFNGFKIK